MTATIQSVDVTVRLAPKVLTRDTDPSEYEEVTVTIGRGQAQRVIEERCLTWLRPKKDAALDWVMENASEWEQRALPRGLSVTAEEVILSRIGEFGRLYDERRPAGRPEVGPQIKVRLPEEVIAAVDALAAAEGITRSAWIRACVSAAVDERRDA